MNNELRDFFLHLYREDYTIITDCCRQLNESQLWTAHPEGVSIANLICHVCEMEGFWLDWGLAGKEFDRDRQIEFDRTHDLDGDALIKRIEKRIHNTESLIGNLSEQQWQQSRQFHGDTFTGQGILLWHIHHLGLHRGHIQVHTRWLQKNHNTHNTND